MAPSTTDKDKKNSEGLSGKNEGRSYSCTRLFIELLLSPNNGWRKIRNSKILPADFERQVLYPLLALTAVCQFFILFYNPSTPISAVLQDAIVAFVAVFAGYFAVLALSRTMLPPDAARKSASKFFRVYVAASLATLDLAYMITLIAPKFNVILWLGVIYTLYIVCRGVKYLHVPQNERLGTSIMACVMVCGLPSAIFALLSFMMPSV